MRNVARLNAEMKLAQEVYGPDAVLWASDYEWVLIYDMPLPPNLNMPRTNVLVLVPESYGYNQPYRDAFVEPGLLVKVNGTHESVPHYFDKFPYPSMSESLKQEIKSKNWAYICLHQRAFDKRTNLITFLRQIYAFLSDPHH